MRARVAVALALTLLACAPAAADRDDTAEILEELRAIQRETSELEAIVRGRQLLADGQPAEEAAPRRLDGLGQEYCETELQKEWIPWMMCFLEYYSHIILDAVLVNYVSFVVCLVGCTFLNSAGYFFEPTWKHGRPWKIAFRAGVVINFFFGPKAITGHPALWSYVFITSQILLSDFVCAMDSVVKLHREWTDSDSGILAKQKQVTTFGVDLPLLKSPADMVVQNRYNQISYPFGRVFVYFFVQFCLFSLYSYTIFTLKEGALPDKVGQVSVLKWFVAVCLCFVAGENQLGGRYSSFFWEQLGDLSDAGLFKDKYSNHFYSCVGMTFRWEWKIRRLLSFFANGVFRSCILGTAPVLVCSLDPLSVIKDAMAVFFITKLDDLDDTLSFIEELVLTYSTAFPDAPESKKMILTIQDEHKKAIKKMEQEEDAALGQE